MLQTGMRAPMGIKVFGPDLASIEQTSIQIESLLKQVPLIVPDSVYAERIVAKPYIEITIDRDTIARYGLSVMAVQDVLETALGGQPVTTTVQGRERYPVRVRYLRELRDSIESLAGIIVPSPSGAQVPLSQLPNIEFVRGPQMIKSEDNFLVNYVLFEQQPGASEVAVVEMARDFLQQKEKAGLFIRPAGTHYEFAGAYQNQLRAEKTLALVLPVTLLIIFLILYLHFNAVSTTLMVFSQVFVAWAGGFLMIWLYSQDWFLDFSVFSTSLRDLFQVHPIYLSVAVWVGFLALFGIATDDGVVIATYLDQVFAANAPTDRAQVRLAVLAGGKRRIRPCLMTTATTILALIPVLTSTGRGADIMLPMAIPSFGGMTIEIISMFVLPVLYCAWAERKLHPSLKPTAP